MNLMNLSIGEMTALIVFAVVMFLQFIIYLLIYLKPFLRHAAEKRGRIVYAQTLPSVSVVVYAHNQAECLMKNLPLLFEQDYAAPFEVIVVNDDSNDDTEDVLTMMEQRSDNFYHTKISEEVRTMSHRKLALMLGVKAARHEVILVTQAQCTPTSKSWIQKMARNFSERVEVVVGPVTYEDRVGFFSRFYVYDLFNRLISAMGLSIAFRPYTAWGMNMAFRKQTFFNNRGFSNHLNIYPGEDDLFVTDVASRSNTKIECSKEALVSSQDENLPYAWSKLRLNRAFTSRYYPAFVKVFNGVDVLSRYLAFLSTIALLILLWQQWVLWGIVLGLYVVRCISVMLVYYFTAKRMGIHRFVFSTLAFDMILPLTDAYYKLKAQVRKKSFYVGRI